MTTQTDTLALQPILLPAAPSWFPLAWGWWAMLAAVVTTLLCIVLYLRWRTHRLRAKRTALKLFEKPIVAHTPSSAIELLRQAALCYFPRDHRVATWRKMVSVSRFAAWRSALLQQNERVAGRLISEQAQRT